MSRVAGKLLIGVTEETTDQTAASITNAPCAYAPTARSSVQASIPVVESVMTQVDLRPSLRLIPTLDWGASDALARAVR